MNRAKNDAATNKIYVSFLLFHFRIEKQTSSFVWLLGCFLLAAIQFVKCNLTRISCLCFPSHTFAVWKQRTLAFLSIYLLPSFFLARWQLGSTGPSNSVCSKNKRQNNNTLFRTAISWRININDRAVLSESKVTKCLIFRISKRDDDDDDIDLDCVNRMPTQTDTHTHTYMYLQK